MASKNRHGNWIGRVKDNRGKERYLGVFPNKEAAEEAERAMRRKLGRKTRRRVICETCGKGRYEEVA